MYNTIHPSKQSTLADVSLTSVQRQFNVELTLDWRQPDICRRRLFSGIYRLNTMNTYIYIQWNTTHIYTFTQAAILVQIQFIVVCFMHTHIHTCVGVVSLICYHYAVRITRSKSVCLCILHQSCLTIVAEPANYPTLGDLIPVCTSWGRELWSLQCLKLTLPEHVTSIYSMIRTSWWLADIILDFTCGALRRELWN